MKKPLFIGSVILISVLSVKIYFHFNASRHTHLEQVKPEGKWPEAPSSNSPTNAGNESVFTKIAPLCAPGSTVYLTQAEQDYRNPERKPNPPEVKQAQREGAEAKITLRVVDSRGVPVPDADIRVAFFHRGSYPMDGKSDTNGFFTAEHRSGADIHFHVSKAGYYKTFRNYWFFREGTQCVRDDKWIPWNPTLEVVLKEKRNPILLSVTDRTELKLPIKDQSIGFDCEKKDWCFPHGEGQHIDLLFTYTFHYPEFSDDEYVSKLVIEANPLGGGLQLLQKDTWSDFPSAYEAPVANYVPKLVLATRHITGKKMIENIQITDNEYLFFRSRVVQDANGNIVRANYGKIYGPILYGGDPKNKTGGIIHLSYYFNTAPNARNLEGTGVYP